MLVKKLQGAKSIGVSCFIFAALSWWYVFCGWSL